MPDRRRHRGRHPADTVLFGEAWVPALCAAAEELSWLLGRGYKMTSALALVGNRHGLRERQRRAVQRAACTDAERASRAARRCTLADVADGPVVLDGFNCIIAVEAALSGGVIIIGRDGVCRDMSSVHGSYRTVDETERAVGLIADVLAPAGALHWILDRPVSNSGRLAALIRERAPGSTVELLDDADATLGASTTIVASGDSLILDRCGPWLDVPAAVIAHHIPTTWRLSL
ncbi:MAG TPA: DUF434 domain-containing protein [Kofleriaceae bacterium]|nr:DUF434 domain-containing protein [Kofleriaceae bacterium]